MKKLFFGFTLCFFINFSYSQTLEIIEISGESSCTIDGNDFTPFFGKYTKHTGSLSPVVEDQFASNNSFCSCYNQEGTSTILYFGSNGNIDFVIVQPFFGTPGNGCGTGSTSNVRPIQPIPFLTRSPQTGMCDLDGFEVIDQVDCEIEVIPTYSNPIPTLSQWGLILIAFLLLIVGIIAIKNKIITVT
jgi:hypothetical protein